MTDRVNAIICKLDTSSVESVMHELGMVNQISDWDTGEKLDLARAFSEVFFHAHHTGATTVPRLAVLIALRIAKFGPELIPFLFNAILDADSESVVYFGKSLAQSGNVGLQYLLPKLKDYHRRNNELINLIQTLSFFKNPEIVKAITIILQISKNSDYQVTSMALYAIGRLVQKLPTSAFSVELRLEMFESVFRFLSNPQVLVRKNATFTLGRMLQKRLLSQENEKKVYIAFLAITGRDEHHNWDRAFIVRREAEDFFPYFRQESIRVNQYAQHFKILSKRLLCLNTWHFTLQAPMIARKIEAGQFIIVRPHIFSERVPLSVCGWNREQGTIQIIVSAVGKTTTEINMMEEESFFKDIVGPLGERSVVPSSTGVCVVIGGGYGTGAVIPSAKDMKALGNKVIGIVGARSKDSVIMVPELEQVCDKVIITTNDGSMGRGGMVTDALREVLQQEKVIHVLAVGPVPMMKAVSELTRPQGIATYVSLNAIMVDGTGMCGACRVTVGGETKFACFHGPDFDGHKVDFENLTKRQKMFIKEEKMAFARMKGLTVGI